VQCQAVKTLAVHCHSDVCSAAGGHSAGCRTSWVCIQHHATVVTSNGVTIYGSKFPPVSKHCQHQHSAIPKTIQQYVIPTIPALVISKVLLPQSIIIAAFFHSYSSLFSDVSSCLQTNNNNNIKYFKYTWCIQYSQILLTPKTPVQSAQFRHTRVLQLYSLWSFPAHLLRHHLKLSQCQNTTLYFNLLMPTDHILNIRRILEKYFSYNEELHQLLIDFKKAHDSVRMEVWYNVIIQFGIPMKLVRLIKMCLKCVAQSG